MVTILEALYLQRIMSNPSHTGSPGMRTGVMSRVPVVGLTLLCAPLVACVEAVETSRLVSEIQYPVDNDVVVETIYEHAGWSDPVYERIYTINGETFASYRNESDEGISPSNPPRLISDWVVVSSSSHVFFWREDREPIHFYPYVAAGWESYATQAIWDAGSGLNGHYDYSITEVQIAGDSSSETLGERWSITYQCREWACPTAESPNRGPETIQFYSDDRGQTFQLLLPEEARIEPMSMLPNFSGDDSLRAFLWG